MILCSLDCESTGLDVVKDRVIEYGGILYSTSQKKCLDNIGVLVKADVQIVPKITKITGITQAAVDRFGYEPEAILDIIIEMIDAADAVLGYNCRRFDKKILDNWANRAGRELSVKPWIDIYADLPWQVPVGKLSHTAADHNILNLYAHSALSDAQTTLAIAEKYDPQFLLDRALSPVVILRAHQARHENDLVKEAPFRFRWNGDRKWWWRVTKVQDVDEVVALAPFNISVEKEVRLEDMEN